MNRLEGKVAMITGGAGAIGEAAAKQFLEEGARVMLVDCRAGAIEAVRERLDAGPRLAVCAADVTVEQAIAGAVLRTANGFGGLDVVFANAGVEGHAGPIETLDLAEFERVLRINVIGVWLTMKHAVEPMKRRGGGSIIAAASVAGVRGFPGVPAYVASKHAVCGLVKSAALELGPWRIRVNAVAPGPVDNRMMRSLEAQLSPENPGRMRESRVAQIPLARYAANEDVARLAAFLASDEASYCTGGIYPLDGGYTAA